MSNEHVQSTPTSLDDGGVTPPSSAPPTIMEGTTDIGNGPASFASLPPVSSDGLMAPERPMDDPSPQLSSPIMTNAGDETEALAAENESDVIASFDDDDDDKPEEEFVPEPLEETARPSSEDLAGKAISVPGPPEPTKKEGLDRDVEEGKDGIVKNIASTKKIKKEKPEINPKFKDVQETGKWGEMSRRELSIAAAAFCVFLVVILTVVGVLVAKNNNDDSDASGDIQYIPAPTKAPTMPPTSIPVDLELALVRDEVNLFDVTLELLEDLPTDAAFYEGLIDDAAATPQQKAMAWLLYQDQLKDPAESALRWALASIYFQMGGQEWTSAEGWLGNDPLCTWEHISCDRGTMQEIDLDEKNVTGNLALEFALFRSIQSVLLRRNQITGPIPGAVFAALPRLGLLYLDNNLLTGTVPVELLDNGGLRKYNS
jgi:hypothetical protein